MPLELETVAPEDLAFHASLAEMLEAIRSREQWSERMAEVLEYAYCERLLKLVRTGAPLEQLRELNEHLAHVVHPRRRAQLDSLGKPYFARWSMLRALLEMRIESLRSEVPSQVLNRKHVREILERVQREGEVTQQFIGETFALEKANLSRILALMEANELIDKVARGNGNTIVLGVRGRELMPPKETAVPRAPAPVKHARRGASYLNPEAADGTFH
ncbi:MarR family transcriptional regulator [Hyalangium minutum]|uniref:Regulatory protein, MarR n=1 Tax=Hyalangium minutum TaxID=394096 RepID=A0A085WLQ3_9BACT|nr:helix-turn-helix domain-containing protein [Hyalangium minutum]KFE68616.1 Regulatory protein, MarR [Hyalangium minutum]